MDGEHHTCDFPVMKGAIIPSCCQVDQQAWLRSVTPDRCMVMIDRAWEPDRTVDGFCMILVIARVDVRSGRHRNLSRVHCEGYIGRLERCGLGGEFHLIS